MSERDTDFLTDGPTDATATIMLAHGAGAPMDSPFMDEVAHGLATAGWRVVRFEFPYMRRRRAEGKRGGPDRAPVLEAAWKDAVTAVAATSPGPIVVGGKSMGGRIASMIADDVAAAGVVCLGYPFHPPGRPDKLRTAHLERIRTPTLILQGTRDPFGTRDEVEAYPLSANVQIHWLEDGDHSFKPRVRSGRTLEQNLAEAVAATADFLAMR